MGLLSGKCIVITGAAQGMGAVHAERCVAEGASVVLTDLQAEAGRKLASRLGDAAVFAEQDVTSEADWDRVVALAKERFGRLGDDHLLPRHVVGERHDPRVAGLRGCRDRVANDAHRAAAGGG